MFPSIFLRVTGVLIAAGLVIVNLWMPVSIWFDWHAPWFYPHLCVGVVVAIMAWVAWLNWEASREKP